MIPIENMWQELKMRVVAAKTTNLSTPILRLQRSLGTHSNGNVPEAWGNLLESSTNNPKNKFYAIDY